MNLEKNIGIKIPKIFVKKLKGEYLGFVQNVIANYSTILINNSFEFFPEYTDHGIVHIQEVLTTASELICDDAYKLLNDKDICVLIVSILLHDIGMHLSSPGLKKILSNEYEEFRVDHFDSKSWHEEWEQFLHEAKRYNDDELMNLFGTTNVEIESPNLDNLNENSKRLCGEFIRKNHARLAHEVSLGGFPTKIGRENICEISLANSDISDLSGLVARSHGISLRETFSYLKDTYDESWKTPNGVKVIFLMVILRISDYIQIQSGRAPKLLLHTKRFSSPLSQQEWAKHYSIKHINTNTDDPERIYVNAIPKDSKTFLGLKDLFMDIQHELDLSWAVLGEVHGKDEKLQKLKIKFRRLQSNIDNLKKFAKKVNYIPEKIRFDADPELLKLLIGPLYGEDEKYGVRELKQNAVDAIKERSMLHKEYDPKIVINIIKAPGSKSSFVLSIKDNGVGMSKDTIINFFLKAGASFRNSMVWKKEFMTDKGVNIAKTGRFGVGVLAVFLLGEEFTLKTRHYSENIGYTCKASLFSKQIEMHKDNSEIGTTIEIVLNNSICKFFNDFINKKNRRSPTPLEWFNWYVMDFPSIQYNIPQELMPIFKFQSDFISSDPDTPSNGWYKMKAKDYQSIHWTVEPKNVTLSDSQEEEKNLVCNGFVIKSGYKFPELSWTAPTLSIFDGNGKLPLSLNRDYLLEDTLPFKEKLAEELCNMILNAISKTRFEKVGDYWSPLKNELLFKKKINLSEYVVVKGNTFSFLFPFIFKELNINLFFQLWVKNDSNPNFVFNSKNAVYRVRKLKSDTIMFYKNLLYSQSFNRIDLDSWFNLGGSSHYSERSKQGKDYLRTNKLDYLLTGNRLPKTYSDNLRNRRYITGWEYVERGHFRNDSKVSLINELELARNEHTLIRENHVIIKDLNIASIIKKKWEEKFGNGNYFIPIPKSIVLLE